MLDDRELDSASKIALVFIFIGWFFIATLVVTLGSLQHGVRFFELPAVIADPTRMFFEIERTAWTFLFGALCLLCLLLPFAVYLRRVRFTRFGAVAPLALMLICGVTLYGKSSGEFFATPTGAASASGNLIRFANGLVHRGSGAIARHVSIGLGGYLAFLASVALAVSGLRAHRRPAADAT